MTKPVLYIERQAIEAGTHEPAVANVVAIEEGPRQKRVIAVEWEQHDVLTCDGTDLALDTDGWLYCPVSGCTWSYDPEFNCPAHSAVPA